MAYKIIVLVKQVPDTQNITGEAMKADGTVNRAALPAIFTPEDFTSEQRQIAETTETFVNNEILWNGI